MFARLILVLSCLWAGFWIILTIDHRIQNPGRQTTEEFITAMAIAFLPFLIAFVVARLGRFVLFGRW